MVSCLSRQDNQRSIIFSIAYKLDQIIVGLKFLDSFENKSAHFVENYVEFCDGVRVETAFLMKEFAVTFEHIFSAHLIRML